MDIRAPVVLIVEDEPLIRWMLAEVLRDAGFTVIEAKNGAEAVERFGPDVDIVLLDIRLPDASGLDLMLGFKDACPRAVVVAMTGHGTPEVERTALERGAWTVLHKPFEVDALVDLLREVRWPADDSASGGQLASP